MTQDKPMTPEQERAEARKALEAYENATDFIKTPIIRTDSEILECHEAMKPFRLHAPAWLRNSLDREEQLERKLKHSQANMKMAVSSIEQKDKELEKCHTTGFKLSAKSEQLIAENEQWKSANQELAKQNRIFHQDTNTMCDKLQAAEAKVAEQDKEIQRLRKVEEDYKALQQIMDRARRLAFLAAEDEASGPRFEMDANGNLTRVEES